MTSFGDKDPIDLYCDACDKHPEFAALVGNLQEVILRGDTLSHLPEEDHLDEAFNQALKSALNNFNIKH